VPLVHWADVTDPIAVEVHATPAPPLRPFVSSYVGFLLSGFPAGVHLGPPTRALTAVISLDDPLEVVSPDGAGVRRMAAVSAGLQTRAIAIHHGGRQHGVKVALTPLGARAVYGLPAAELADTVVPLEDLLHALGAELLERIRAATTWDARFRTLDELLARAVARGARQPSAEAGVHAAVAATYRRLVAARGMAQVGAIAAELGWSRRHLTERFRAEVGVTPKTLARILRFEHAHALVTTDDPPPWAEVATTAGYADQAHLVRDWRAFTGRTPTDWRRGEVLPAAEPRLLTSGDGAPSPRRR